MKRRALLALGCGTLVAGLSGCVGDDNGSGTPEDDGNGTDENDGGREADGTDDGSQNSDDSNSVPEYADQLEECNLIRLQYDSFPEEIQAEIDAAIADGQYETEVLLFDKAVDTRESYVVRDGTPYEPTVESKGETKTLELTQVDAVRMPQPYRVSVENNDEREYTVGIRLESGEGDVKLETEKAVPSGDRIRNIETEAQKFGTYTLTVELVDEGVTETNTVRIGDAYMDPFEVWISDGEIGITQVVAELVPCPHAEFV